VPWWCFHGAAALLVAQHSDFITDAQVRLIAVLLGVDDV
jgi:hypothetical protein